MGEAIDNESPINQETARLYANPHTVAKLEEAEKGIIDAHSVGVNWSGQMFDVGMRVGTINGTGISRERKIGMIQEINFDTLEAKVDWHIACSGYSNRPWQLGRLPFRKNHVWIHLNNLFAVA